MSTKLKLSDGTSNTKELEIKIDADSESLFESTYIKLFDIPENYTDEDLKFDNEASNSAWRKIEDLISF